MNTQTQQAVVLPLHQLHLGVLLTVRDELGQAGVDEVDVGRLQPVTLTAGEVEVDGAVVLPALQRCGRLLRPLAKPAAPLRCQLQRARGADDELALPVELAARTPLGAHEVAPGTLFGALQSAIALPAENALDGGEGGRETAGNDSGSGFGRGGGRSGCGQGGRRRSGSGGPFEGEGCRGRLWFWRCAFDCPHRIVLPSWWFLPLLSVHERPSIGVDVRGRCVGRFTGDGCAPTLLLHHTSRDGLLCPTRSPPAALLLRLFHLTGRYSWRLWWLWQSDISGVSILHRGSPNIRLLLLLCARVRVCCYGQTALLHPHHRSDGLSIPQRILDQVQPGHRIQPLLQHYQHSDVMCRQRSS